MICNQLTLCLHGTWVLKFCSDKEIINDLITSIPHPHGQFGTQVPNTYFNYYKVILQLQQYLNQLWAAL